ncbi:hypothetical protein Q8A67_025670 [Cirrhinus molitorella]|uniref:Uncharacterized protein n=1 Tax=Cirrhinus molitorella TaxID=172907 RepID=A0AA88T9W7_9TELE|nr:hypothetical protein Q8A67_025670 [Cirrhinus molitorella]
MCTSSTSTLSSIDGAEEKGYDKLPPQNEFGGHTSLPPLGHRMEGKDCTPFQAMQDHVRIDGIPESDPSSQAGGAVSEFGKSVPNHTYRLAAI